MKRRAVLIRVFLITLPVACVEPYYPPAGTGTGNQMVINGYIDGTTRVATVKLTRGIPLAEPSQPAREAGADVVIVGSDGTEYVLKEEDANQPGVYTATDLTFNDNAVYNLRVKTASGDSYSSDAVQLLRSPELDSVWWEPTTDGIHFYVAGHDPENNTHYYRWAFAETWEYNVPVWSDYKKDGAYMPVLRGPGEFVYFCWDHRSSTDILISSTTQLAEDVVSKYNIHFIKKGSRSLSRMYRIKVRQYAISRDEFEFWEMMEKTTENLGGLFDPLPAQVLGNVHKDNDTEVPVLGYFSAGYPDEKLIYVSHLDLPSSLAVVDPYTFDCGGRSLYLWELDKIRADEVWVKQFGTPVQGYIVTNEKCGDCRKLGGDNKRPDDWPLK